MRARDPLRSAAALLLIGRIAFIAITWFHTGGAANEHVEVFEAYAASGSWTVVHLGQFVAMAVLLAGLFTLFLVLDGDAKAVRLLGAAASVAALALYGALQAVDGVALKQAVNAWLSAPEPEAAARFAGAEVVRWLEWGLRSYQNYAMGLALMLLVVSLAWSERIPRPMAYLVGLSALAYLAQGWVVGSEGFSEVETMAIVLAYFADLVWMIWLVIVVRPKEAAA